MSFEEGFIRNDTDSVRPRVLSDLGTMRTPSEDLQQGSGSWESPNKLETDYEALKTSNKTLKTVRFKDSRPLFSITSRARND